MALRPILVATVLMLAPALMSAQALGRIATVADSVPHSVEEAEAYGARFSRPSADELAHSQLSERKVPGSSERRCVNTKLGDEVRSGDIVAGGFSIYSRIWHDGLGKLWWTPHQLAWPDTATPLVVRARRLDGSGEVRVFEKRTSARTVGVSPESHFFPTAFHLPSTGTWLLVATAGANWGCFVFTFL